MKPVAAMLVAIPLLFAETASTPLRVTGIRHWQLGEVTRVAVEVSGSFEFRTDRLHNPERVYFDILNAHLKLESKSEPAGGGLLKKVRAAETTPGITRIVLDLADGVEPATSQLVNPNRLIIELRTGAASAAPAAPPPVDEIPKPKPTAVPASPKPKPPVTAETEPPPASELSKPKPTALPAVSKPKPPVTPKTVPPVDEAPSSKPAPVASTARPKPAMSSEASSPVAETPTRSAPVKTESQALVAELPPEPNIPLPDSASPLYAAPAPVLRAVIPTTVPIEKPKSAKPTSDGESSLIRTLGLKINRVVIDPGHGGHDEGTVGPKGLLEKDLVLDVAQRLGRLIEQRMSSEVIYTRTDDTFIPLEGRTALANDKMADLFLSIHANSSPARGVTGIETYYLNFTQSQDAIAVAARENASSQKSVFELQDLIQKITLHDKAEESREFANRIQTSLQALSSRSFPGEKNRGVRKAPFVVLIGAQMPSVLAEIGFLSNAREEALLRKPDYRQKIAEALFRGLSRYADGLSHFQVAKN